MKDFLAKLAIKKLLCGHPKVHTKVFEFDLDKTPMTEAVKEMNAFFRGVLTISTTSKQDGKRYLSAVTYYQD